jgi:hypothetical protein
MLLLLLLLFILSFSTKIALMYLQVKLERLLIDSHKVKNDAVLKTLVVTKPISSDKQQLIAKSITSTSTHQQISANHAKEVNTNESNASGAGSNELQSRSMKQEATSIRHEQQGMIEETVLFSFSSFY